MIGPRFAEEVTAAGVTAGLAWNDERVLNLHALPESERAKVLAVLAVHDPTVPASPDGEALRKTVLAAKIDAALANAGVQPAVKDVLTALRALFT